MDEPEGRPFLAEAEEDRRREIEAATEKAGETESEEQQQLPRTKSGLHRCKTAPAMDMAAVLRELKGKVSSPNSNSSSGTNDTNDIGSIGGGGGGEQIRQAGLLLLMYLLMGVVVYGLNRDQFSGSETHPVVDALYFCIVTMCTIGYGDITPLTPSTKLFACLFVLVGFGFIDILLSAVVNHFLDLQERNLIAGFVCSSATAPAAASASASHHRHPHQRNHFLVDVAKGRMRIRLKVALALAAVVLCIGVGTLALYFLEGLSWVDSFYLSALSVTTVGYGDRAFTTLLGRLFAALWLLFSTLAVARAFLYLVEARIDKRQRSLAKWVLQRDITPQDLLAANINNNDFISKSEYVLYKLKEMGKIGEQDISQICTQFQKLDPNNLGRITLPDLLQNCS